MASLDLAQVEGKALGLWNRPGGKLKGILLIALFGFIAWKVLPTFTQALDNTAEFAWGLTYATLAMICAGLAILLAYTLLTSKRVRAIGLALWDLIMDWTIGLIVPYNPKVLARQQVAANFKEVENLEKNVDEVAQEEEKVEKQLSDNTTQIKTIEADMARNAQLSNNPELLQRRNMTKDNCLQQLSILENRKNRYTEWNKRLTPVYNTIKDTRIKLNQLAGYAKTQAQIFKDNVEMQISEYESMASASNAAKRFANVLAGKNDRSFMGERALMFMNEQIAKDSADLKQILRRSKDFIQSINLQDAQFDQSAINYLNEYNQKYLDNGATPVQVVKTFETQAAPKTQYDNLI
jgi:hypothetical protein